MAPHGLEGFVEDEPLVEREPKAGETWYDDRGPVLIVGDPFDHRIGRVVSGRRWDANDPRRGTAGNIYRVSELGPAGSAKAGADRLVDVDADGKRHITFVCELPDFVKRGITIGKSA